MCWYVRVAPGNEKKKSVFIEWLLWTQMLEKAELSPNPTSWHPKAVWPWASYLTFVRLSGKWGPETLLLGAVGTAVHGPVQNITCDSGLGSPAAVVHPWHPNLWMENSFSKLNPCHHLFFYFTLFYFKILYWFCHTLTWIHHRCSWVPNPEPPFHLPPHIISLGHPSAPAPSILYPVSNLDWRFVSYMIVYMFQCHSPKSSHPLPLSSKVHSTHLCLFCCLAYRVIITIFLNSIYMC